MNPLRSLMMSATIDILAVGTPVKPAENVEKNQGLIRPAQQGMRNE